MGITIKWIEVDANNWKGGTGYSEYKIIRKPKGRGKYLYHGYKNLAYIAQGNTLEEAQLQILNWIKKLK